MFWVQNEKEFMTTHNTLHSKNSIDKNNQGRCLTSIEGFVDVVIQLEK